MSKTIEVKLAQEHIDKDTKVNVEEGISQLIWNSCDADATRIEVALELTSVDGIDSVIIEDNGHGFNYKEIENLLGLYGKSDKSYKMKSPKGRSYHGKNGRGRYTAFSIGEFMKIETIYIAEDNKKYKFYIDLNSSNKMSFSFTDKELMPDETPTGTIVTLSSPTMESNVLLNKEIMSEKIIYSFAPYLLAYKDISIIYDGTRISPKENIEDIKEMQIISEFGESSKEAEVKIICWKNGYSKSQRMYICGKDGTTYTDLFIDTKGHSITVYILSDLFDDMAKNNVLDFINSNPNAESFTCKAKNMLMNYINERYYNDAVEEVKNVKETDLYPYKKETENEIEVAERQYFDLIAVEINKAIPSFKKRSNKEKKLTYRLIQETVKTNPDSLTTILTEVFRLSCKEQDDLAKLLNCTTLPAIINTSKVISDRLSFLQALEQMVYNKEIGKSIKERTQFHKILLEELWIFGEKYTLGASDISLKNVLKKYLKHLERVDLSPTIPTEAMSNANLIPDLCLWKQYCIQEERMENLVIELKRPTKTLGEKELSQIKNYAYAIADDESFPKENTKWKFLLLGMNFDSFVEKELRNQKNGEGNYYNSEDGNISISVYKWNQVIQENKLKLNFLKDKLGHEIKDNKSALEYLNDKYSKFFLNKIV